MGNRLSFGVEGTHEAEILQSPSTKNEAKAAGGYSSSNLTSGFDPILFSFHLVIIGPHYIYIHWTVYAKCMTVTDDRQTDRPRHRKMCSIIGHFIDNWPISQAFLLLVPLAHRARWRSFTVSALYKLLLAWLVEYRSADFRHISHRLLAAK